MKSCVLCLPRLSIIPTADHVRFAHAQPHYHVQQTIDKRADHVLIRTQPHYHVLFAHAQMRTGYVLLLLKEHTFFFKRSNNRHTKQKKRAIVQQTIGITDNVAVHQYVHYRPVCRHL